MRRSRSNAVYRQSLTVFDSGIYGFGKFQGDRFLLNYIFTENRTLNQAVVAVQIIRTVRSVRINSDVAVEHLIRVYRIAGALYDIAIDIDPNVFGARIIEVVGRLLIIVVLVIFSGTDQVYAVFGIVDPVRNKRSFRIIPVDIAVTCQNIAVRSYDRTVVIFVRADMDFQAFCRDA